MHDDEALAAIRKAATAQMLLRDALSWFDSHAIEERVCHLPEWVTMARRLLEDDIACRPEWRERGNAK